MVFGQLVVGPPGSGKTTYCNGMQQFLTAAGRKVAVVNLDPANDTLPYECAVDIMDLISLQEVMREFKLGPNGGKSPVSLHPVRCKRISSKRDMAHSWLSWVGRSSERVDVNIPKCLRPGMVLSKHSRLTALMRLAQQSHTRSW